MSVRMEVNGADAAEVMRQVSELAALAAGNPLDKIETTALLQELRDRLAKNGQVVKVVPFDSEKISGEGDTPSNEPTTRRTRNKKESVQTPAAPEQAAAPSEAPKSVIEEAEQTIAESVAMVPAVAEVSVVAEPVTIDAVKSALNAFAAVNGQVEARKIMQNVGGSPALKDIAAEKYGELVLALTAEMKQAA